MNKNTLYIFYTVFWLYKIKWSHTGFQQLFRFIIIRIIKAFWISREHFAFSEWPVYMFELLWNTKCLSWGLSSHSQNSTYRNVMSSLYWTQQTFLGFFNPEVVCLTRFIFTLNLSIFQHLSWNFPKYKKSNTWPKIFPKNKL